MDGRLPPPQIPQNETYPEITMTPAGQIGGTSNSGVTAIPPIVNVGDPNPPGAGQVGSGYPNPENYGGDKPAKVNPGTI